MGMGTWGQIMFRSARSGHKNLYLMDARGEEYGLTRLTEGPWTDTMPEARPCSLSQEPSPRARLKGSNSLGALTDCGLYAVRQCRAARVSEKR